MYSYHPWLCKPSLLTRIRGMLWAQIHLSVALTTNIAKLWERAVPHRCGAIAGLFRIMGIWLCICGGPRMTHIKALSHRNPTGIKSASGIPRLRLFMRSIFRSHERYDHLNVGYISLVEPTEHSHLKLVLTAIIWFV